ncbi:hypothetical protein D9756_009304 [Leucocoprinus leucothites]|uniref:Uncharacterized protein n=1 Tax=Leucocoprinus leucothites TaxID=201217 RepID=A0A8H5D0G8_9AGAR|nr:hypothetical protein D9756_009304 [Leucoagaricus leucothites]
MSAAIGLQDSSVPSESWDDDFDFQSQSGSPKRTRNAQETPATMRMSTATEDWDIDNLTSTTSVTNHEPPRPSPHVLADKINITAANLANWSEQDPTTPQKASFSIEPTTENWDDDFLDKTDSPARRSSRSNNTPSRHSIGGKLRAGVPVRHHKPLREGEEEEHESWDDEFDFNSSPAKPTKSSTPGKSRRTPVRHSAHRSSLSPGNHPDSSDDDDEADFGGIGAEDDRTVTARSRRAPQSHTPPPPVPTIPFTLTPVTASASTSTNTHLTTPFPRSPTASVFSVPGSSIAETTSLRSTAPLRPSLSRNAASASNALKYFPPSPPLHRERRRLRKKSRPQPQGVMELVDMSHHHHYPLSDTDADHQRLDELDERRTPSPPPTPDPISASVPPTPSQSTSTGGALLSRIGSVKRWNVRRKKGSSTPSDAPAKEEKGKDTTNHSDGVPVPRPRTSLSSLLPSNQQQQSTTNALPPPSSSWFFRPTSPVNSRGRNAHGKNQTSTSIPRTSYTGSRSGSMTDLSMRGSIYASSSNYEDDDTNNFSTQKSPNKLLKRKSLGFVQLRKGLMPSTSIPTTSGGSAAEKGGFGGDLSLSLSDLHQYKSGPGSKRPMSMQPQPRLPSGMHPATQRHASYGTTRPKKVAEVNTDDLHNHESESTRDRKQSSTSRNGGVRPKSKAVVKEKESKENVRNIEREKERERDEGSRSFMGSMRRLSLVNRHRRNKSGASLMETMSRISAEAPTTSPPPPLPSTSESPSLPPLPLMSDFHVPRPRTPHTPVSSSVPSLLPPIELQPPSPPRPDGGPGIALSPNTDSLLSPVSTTSSSVAPATTPTSASAGTSTSTLSSSPSSSASSSPRSTKQTPKTPGPTTVRSSPPKRFSPKTPRTPKTTTSPHGTASLGRSTISPKHGILGISPAEAFPRRNSLSDLKSDLKIPARISQAQQGLKRDLGMVRDFAVYIEQLKKQQEMYHDLVQRMQHKLDAQAHLAQQQTSSTQQQQRAVSPSFFNLTKPKTRARSNTNPGNGSGSRYKELAAAFYTINSKYRISWECAELLVDLADGTSAALGSGPGNVGEGVPSSSVSAPVGLGASGEKKKGGKEQ